MQQRGSDALDAVIYTSASLRVMFRDMIVQTLATFSCGVHHELIIFMADLSAAARLLNFNKTFN